VLARMAAAARRTAGKVNNKVLRDTIEDTVSESN
jgi:hypothetical protein